MSYSQTFAIDAATGLIKRAVAQAAVTGSAVIGTQLDQLVATATDMALLLNVEAITINGATGETYRFTILGSNVSNRSDAEILGGATIGKATQVAGGETRDAVAGDRLVIPFRTEKNRTKYRYIDVYLTVAGTSPSITFNAYLTKEAC